MIRVIPPAPRCRTPGCLAVAVFGDLCAPCSGKAAAAETIAKIRRDLARKGGRVATRARRKGRRRT